MKKHFRAVGLTATAVAAGLIASIAVTGVANAEEAVTGQGSVILDFSTPGSVDIDVWTKNTSAIPAWGTAVVRDVDGAIYPFGPRGYAPGEVYTYAITLDGYTCADLGRGANAFAFGFDARPQSPADLADYEWTSGPVSYPDPRITVIGCDSPPPPPPVDPEDPPVITPTDGGTTTPTVTTPTATAPTATAPTATTPTATNTLPAAKTDGAELTAGSTSSPMFGVLFTLGALLVAAVGAMAGPLRRR